jgi:hypothetical protein
MIIDLRRAQPFRSVNDLIRVTGIGRARLHDIMAEVQSLRALGQGAEDSCVPDRAAVGT